MLALAGQYDQCRIERQETWIHGGQHVRNKSPRGRDGKSALKVKIKTQPKTQPPAEPHHRHITRHVNDLPDQPNSQPSGRASRADFLTRYESTAEFLRRRKISCGGGMRLSCRRSVHLGRSRSMLT